MYSYRDLNYYGRRGCTQRTMRRWFVVASLISAIFIATALFYDPQYLERLARRIKPGDGSYDQTEQYDTQSGSVGPDGKQHVFGFPFYQKEGGEGVPAPAEELGGQLNGTDTRNMRDGQIMQELGESQSMLNQETLAGSEEGMLNVGHSQGGNTGDTGESAAKIQESTGSRMSDSGAPGAGQMVNNGAMGETSPIQGNPPNVPGGSEYRIPSQTGQSGTTGTGQVGTGTGQIPGAGNAFFKTNVNAPVMPGSQQAVQKLLSDTAKTGAEQNAEQSQQIPAASQGQVSGQMTGQVAGQSAGQTQQNPSGQLSSGQSVQNEIRSQLGRNPQGSSVQTLGENVQEMQQRAMMAAQRQGQLNAMGQPQQPSQLQGQALNASPGQGQLSNMGQGQPSNMGQGQPSNVGQGQPINVGQGQPSNVGQGQPSNVGQGQPSNVVQGQPSNVGQGQPSNIAQQPIQAQGQPANAAQDGLLKRALSR